MQWAQCTGDRLTSCQHSTTLLCAELLCCNPLLQPCTASQIQMGIIGSRPHHEHCSTQCSKHSCGGGAPLAEAGQILVQKVDLLCRCMP